MAEKGSGHPTLLCRWPRMLVALLAHLLRSLVYAISVWFWKRHQWYFGYYCVLRCWKSYNVGNGLGSDIYVSSRPKFPVWMRVEVMLSRKSSMMRVRWCSIFFHFPIIKGSPSCCYSESELLHRLGGSGKEGVKRRETMTRSLPLAQAFLCPTPEGQWDRRNGTLFLYLLGAISITANILYALVETVHWPEKRKK